MVIDRYEIGERQTSACGVPTLWLEALDLMGSHQQTFGELVIHTPRTPPVTSCRGPSRRSITAALRPACRSGRFQFETAKVNSRDGNAVHTDRGELRAPLIVDALGGAGYSAAARRSNRRTPTCHAASRSIRTAPATTSRSGSTVSTYPPATAGAFRPTARSVSASARSTRASTSRTQLCSSPRIWSAIPSATRATGFRTGSARRPRAGSSSPATPPVTACR